jgi:hypothetical protein
MKTIQIDISDVPEDKRTDPQFLALLADMQKRCTDQRLVNAICIHEAAHVFFLAQAGLDKPTAQGPKIFYDQIKNQFDAHGSSVKFNGRDQNYIDKLDSYDWLGRLAKGYAAGGVAARVLANSEDRGDEDDRANFDKSFAKIKSQNPTLTMTSDEFWAAAQASVEKDLQIPGIKNPILMCADGLKPELFCVS